MFDFGILGMNARNINYIKRYNEKSAILLADNKIKTKKALSGLGIPFAKTLMHITSHEQLKHFTLGDIHDEHIVLKPNKGSKGKGIIVLDKIGEDFFYDGEKIEFDELYRHMQDILDGAYSISGLNDSIVIEEKLIPHHDFHDFCTYGLADIRVIVFNFVPVAAMVRVPTEESEGKANLAQGGIGLGVDIGTGKISSASYKGKIYTRDFPDKISEFKGKKIPYWDDILLYSSRIQGFVNLGYLALDWVITTDGPKLLEINARAGLEIQNVTGVPLKSRLDRVKNIKISDFTKGVSIAKSLFSSESHMVVDDSNSLYLSQLGSIKYKEEKKVKTIPVTIKVDTNLKNSIASQDILPYFKKRSFSLHIDGSTISFSKVHPDENPDTNTKGEIVLGTTDIKNYIIRPVHKYQTVEVYFDTKLFYGVRDLDLEIYEVGKQLNLSFFLKPQNIEEECQKFIEFNGDYNPVFQYKFPHIETLTKIEEKLLGLQERVKNTSIEDKIVSLYDEKIKELFCKLSLLKGYVQQDYEKIDKYQKRLFGESKKELFDISSRKVEAYDTLPKKSEMLGRVLTEDEVVAKIKEKLVMYALPDTEIYLRDTNTARISITTGKRAKINLKKGLKMYEKELDAVLAHELGVHLRRFINGDKSSLKILKHGTGFYIEDEEGIAIYNSLRYLPENYEKNDMYIKYYLCAEAHKYSFSGLGKLIASIYKEKDLKAIFYDCLRLKKGIIDTSVSSVPGVAYEKDRIYLAGYTKVKNWVEKGGYIENLMVGKVKIKDIENLSS